jgi:hypothetical protein
VPQLAMQYPNWHASVLERIVYFLALLLVEVAMFRVANFLILCDLFSSLLIRLS